MRPFPPQRFSMDPTKIRFWKCTHDVTSRRGVTIGSKLIKQQTLKTQTTACHVGEDRWKNRPHTTPAERLHGQKLRAAFCSIFNIRACVFRGVCARQKY